MLGRGSFLFAEQHLELGPRAGVADVGPREAGAAGLQDAVA